jgi:tripartite-type tricarboxylate transporter receptor subunit TctC
MFKKSVRKIAIIFVGGALIIFMSAWTASAEFPVKPVRIIIGSAAGGGDDTESRAIATYLEKYLKVSVIIENQPGAAGKIAFEKFMKTKPDGYSLMASSFPKGPIIETMEKVNFSIKYYTPVYAWSRTNSLLVVHADTWKTTDEFLSAAKVRVLSGGLSGRGSTTHLQGLIAMDALKIKVNWVPYEGASGSVAALAGKHLDFTICLAASAIPLIDGGKLRPLLLFGDERDPFLPDVPTPRDLGYNIASVPAIRGVHAPPHTPGSVVKILESGFSKVVKDPGFLQWGKNRKMIPYNLTAMQFGKIVIETYPTVEKFKQLLKE